MSTIGERIRELRGKISREAFAAKYAIHRNTLERYEKNLRNPDVLFLQELAQQENVNLEWVQLGVGPKYKKDLRRVAGVQTFQQSQPIENTDIDIQNTCDTSQVSELQRQITDLQERLSVALGKGMDIQERLMTMTQENADLRVQAERYLSRIRELERENDELRAMRKRTPDFRSQRGQDVG